MDAIPPYSGQPSHCTKCGHTDIGTTYARKGAWCNLRAVYTERLCRTCKRCHYHWDEATVDADKQAEPDAAPGRCPSSHYTASWGTVWCDRPAGHSGGHVAAGRAGWANPDVAAARCEAPHTATTGRCTLTRGHTGFHRVGAIAWADRNGWTTTEMIPEQRDGQ